MKRIAKLFCLFLILTICVSSLAACSNPNANPATAVRAVAEAFFVDYDADGLFEAHAKYSLDLVKFADESKAAELKEDIKEARDEIKTELEKMEEKADGKKIEIGDSISYITYNKNDSYFDGYLEKFIYYGTGIENHVDEIAVAEYTVIVDGESAESTMIAYKIDEKWYVGA